MQTHLQYETYKHQFAADGSISDLFRVAGGPIEIREYRDERTYMNRVLHSFNDLPAEMFYGDKFWYCNNKLYRDNASPKVGEILVEIKICTTVEIPKLNK